MTHVSATRQTRNLNRKIALIVAINYSGSSIQLNGCENDGNNMARFYASLGYEVTTVSHTAAVSTARPALEPTKANIIAMIKQLALTENMTDFAFFYAGHGTQMRDLTGDEEDGMDEVLVCQAAGGPSRMPARQDMFVDDEFVALLRSTLSSKPINLHLMFDGCHTGSICDLRYIIAPRPKLDAKGLKKETGEQWRIVCVSAAADNQCALEANGGGLLTTRFMQCCTAGAPTIAKLRESFGTMSFQTPHISSAQPISDTTKFCVSIVDAPEAITRHIDATRRQIDESVPATRALPDTTPPYIVNLRNNHFSLATKIRIAKEIRMLAVSAVRAVRHMPAPVAIVT